MIQDDSHVSELSSTLWTGLEQRVRRFEQAWTTGARPSVHDFLPVDPAQRLPTLIELVKTDLEFRFLAGEPARLEDYLESFSELGDPRVLPHLLETERSLSRQFENRPAPSFGGLPAHSSGVDQLASELAPGAGRNDFTPSAVPGSRSLLLAGRRIGKYQLLEEVGRGTAGVVYRGLDMELDREVSVKVQRSRELCSSEAIERFIREAVNLARLRHPNIVTLYDAGQIDGHAYLVCGYLAGTTLADRLAVDNCTGEQGVEWLAQIADAAHAAHEQGVIHRDIKPSNILIDTHDRAYLIDFGLARRLEAGATMTHEGDILGTPAFMSPEQAKGQCHKVDARTDVYSLGVVLYQVLTHDVPFRGQPLMVLAQIVEDDPIPPRRLDGSVPGDLETICLKAIAREPGTRYSTAAAFADDLRRYQRGEPIHARVAGPVRRLLKRCRRKPLLTTLLAALALSVIVGGSSVVWQWGRAEQQRLRAVSALSQINEMLIELNRRRGDPLIRMLSPQEVERLHLQIYQKSKENMPEQVDFIPGLADASFHVAESMQLKGEWKEALSTFEEAEGSFNRLVQANPMNLEARYWLANCLRKRGQISLRNGLAESGRRLLLEGQNQYRRLGEAATASLAGTPKDETVLLLLADAEANLADIEQDLSNRADEIGALKRCAALAERIIQTGTGKLQASAKRIFVQSLDSLCRLLPQDRPDEIASLRSRISSLLHKEIESPGFTELPSVLRGRFLIWLAIQEDHADQGESALRHFQSGIETLESLGDEWLLSEDRSMLGVSYHITGRLLCESSRFAEALEPFRKAIRFRARLSQADPQSVSRRSDLIGATFRRADALDALGRFDEALEHFQQVVIDQRWVCSREPDEIKHRIFLDERLRLLSNCYLKLGRPADAMAAILERSNLGLDDPSASRSVAVDIATVMLSQTQAFNITGLLKP